MFTLVVREPGGTAAAGTVLVNGVDVLCRAEEGDGTWQTGSCTVRYDCSSEPFSILFSISIQPTSILWSSLS